MLVGDGQIVAVGPGLTAQYPGATIRDCSGLVIWLRLDGRARTRIPAHAAYDSIDEAPLKILQGVPYTWPVGAPRRVENFVDLAHFAWVHDGILGRRDEPVPPMPSVARRCRQSPAKAVSCVSRSTRRRWRSTRRRCSAIRNTAEDEPVVCNQDPPEIHLEPGFELSVRTDRVSIEYRRGLSQLAAAATAGPSALLDLLGESRSSISLAP